MRAFLLIISFLVALYWAVKAGMAVGHTNAALGVVVGVSVLGIAFFACIWFIELCFRVRTKWRNWRHYREYGR